MAGRQVLQGRQTCFYLNKSLFYFILFYLLNQSPAKLNRKYNTLMVL